jgi:hypothetical protein
LLSLAVATVLTGCINADPNSTVAPPAEPVTSAPPAEPETSAPATGQPDITPDNPGDGKEPKPAVSLPRLPVGGNGEFVDETQDLQCANVSWIVEQGGPGELGSGIRIVITGFQLDEHSFRFTRHGCEDVAPSCVGYTFTSGSGSPACALAVRTRRPLRQAPDPQLGIAGTIECVDVSVTTCRDFVQAAAENRGSVELAIPSPDTTGSPYGTESSATPNGEQHTTDDEAQPTTGSSDPSPTSEEESPGNSDS